MRFFITIAVTCALAFAAPVSCPHALAAPGQGADAVKDPHMAHGRHGKAGHHGDMGHKGNHDSGHETAHQGCPDNCDGGADCSGCAVISGIFQPFTFVSADAIGMARHRLASDYGTGVGDTFDPPPPRA